MKHAFESIIDTFLATRVGLTDQFLGADLSNHLRAHLLVILAENLFNEAGIGNDAKLHQDKLIRSDSIYWLDRSHNNVYENSFFDRMDEFIKFLNETCYSGITGYEFHYAYYDVGSFYKRHLDQFKDNSNRSYSMIMYLNKNWVLADGGELCVYHENVVQVISPNDGKCIFFKSNELEHEVLLSNKPRLSITGWLKTN